LDDFIVFGAPDGKQRCKTQRKGRDAVDECLAIHSGNSFHVLVLLCQLNVTDAPRVACACCRPVSTGKFIIRASGMRSVRWRTPGA
jgi:hypothetical protein